MYVYMFTIDHQCTHVCMCVLVLNIMPQAFAYHPLYSKYLDKTGVLVRKDEDFECWWAGASFASPFPHVHAFAVGFKMETDVLGQRLSSAYVF